MIKIASFVFNPFTHDSRVLKEAVSLHKAGYDITVIAHGNKGLAEEEELQDIKVKRLSYLDRSVTKRKLAKLGIYLSYVYQAIRYVKRFDVMHCHDLNTLIIGTAVKKIFNPNVKIVYDAHEYETEINSLQGIQKTLTKKLEQFLIKYADKVICVSDAIANEYVKLYNIPKPALVLNTPPYKEIVKKDIFREALGISKDKTIFLYQGGLSSGRGIEILLDTFKNITDNQSIIVFMGYGPLESLVREYADTYTNIYFHKAVEPDILLDYTCSADFGISTIEDTCLSYRYCLPNKMFEYLMAEIPVIVSNLYEMKRLVENNNIGVVAEENTLQGLKEAINKAVKLDKKKIQNNIRKVNKTYNWEEQEKVLLAIYKDIK